MTTLVARLCRRCYQGGRRCFCYESVMFFFRSLVQTGKRSICRGSARSSLAKGRGGRAAIHGPENRSKSRRRPCRHFQHQKRSKNRYEQGVRSGASCWGLLLGCYAVCLQKRTQVRWPYETPCVDIFCRKKESSTSQKAGRLTRDAKDVILIIARQHNLTCLQGVHLRVDAFIMMRSRR